MCVYSSTTYEEHLTEERKSTKTPDQRELDLVLKKRDVLPESGRAERSKDSKEPEGGGGCIEMEL